MQEATQYRAPNIDDIVPLNMSDERVLQEIRAVLERHGMLERFGVCLLHSHFPVDADEVLVEECDVEKRELLIRPRQKADPLRKSMVETMWRFDKNEASLVCFQTCSANGPNGTHSRKHVKGA